MPRDLTTLMHDTAVTPTERPDVDRLVQRGRRRRQTRHVIASTVAAGALVGVALAGTSLLGSPQVPTVADQPGSTSPPAVEIPEGWTTLVSGDLALSVPPGWTYAFTLREDESSADNLCRIALPPAHASQYSPSVMVDLGPPTAFPCSPVTMAEAPAQPVVWLLQASSAGDEVNDARDQGVPTRIGSVYVWRVDQPPFVSYVAADGSGVLWASPWDHPELDAVLATLRRATPNDLRAFEALRRDRSPMPWNPTVLPPSQSAADASRDGVLPEVAALPFHVRVEIWNWDFPTVAVTNEGVWVVSRMNTELSRDYSDGCGIGDVHNPEARDILDVICDVEYGEVLLLNHDRDRILRAFPLPSAPPQTLLVTDDAVYCARQGDGGVRNSMLCRIDRATGEWVVRLFRHEADGQDPWPPADVLPDHWILDRLPDEYSGSMYGPLAIVDDLLVIEYEGRTTRFDPNTLELLAD